MPFIELQHSFDKTNFDLEDGAPSGGPINASNYGHQHTYTPQNKFIFSPEYSGVLETDGFSGNPAIPGTGFLDLENNGPTNVPVNGHQQSYTPQDTFESNPAGTFQQGNLWDSTTQTSPIGGFSGNPNVPGTGFLDLQNNAPTNVPVNGHQQSYTPQDTFESTPAGTFQQGVLWDSTTQTSPIGGFSGNPNIPGTGFLDLQNNTPINAPNNSHQQNYTPQDTFENSPAGTFQQGVLWDSATQTSPIGGFSGNPNIPGTGFLDLQNNAPINAPNNLHQQNYTPQDTFESTPAGTFQQGVLWDSTTQTSPIGGFDGPDQLDIETDPKTFFPKTNGRNSTFVQNWGPNANEFIQSEQGSKTGGKLYPTPDPNSPFANQLSAVFDGDLDLENNDPAVVGISGGGKEGFQPKYTPKKGQGYITPGEQESDLVKVEPGGEVVDLGSLKITALDIESDKADSKEGDSGGPRRLVNQSKKSFQSGQYTVKRAGGLGVGSIAGMNGQGGGVIKQTLHTYTPTNPYFEAGGLDLTPIGSAQNVNSVPFTPKNNIVESNEEQGYDATI